MIQLRLGIGDAGHACMGERDGFCFFNTDIAGCTAVLWLGSSSNRLNILASDGSGSGVDLIVIFIAGSLEFDVIYGNSVVVVQLRLGKCRSGSGYARIGKRFFFCGFHADPIVGRICLIGLRLRCGCR